MANNLTINSSHVPDISNNTAGALIGDYKFDISGASGLASQYLLVGDGKVANPNEKITLSNTADEVTLTLVVGNNYFMKLVQKVGSTQTISKLNFTPLIAPRKGTITNIRPLDRAFKVDVSYADTDNSQWTVNKTPLDKVTFLLSHMDNDGDIFEIEKDVSYNESTGYMQSRFILSNLDLSYTAQEDVSGIQNTYTYDINFFATNLKGEGPLSEPQIAQPVNLPDQAEVLINSDASLNYNNTMHLLIKPPADYALYNSMTDMSAVILRAMAAGWADPIYHTIPKTEFDLIPNILEELSGNGYSPSTFEGFKYEWQNSSFANGLDISFSASYQNKDGQGGIGDELVYADSSYNRWSDDVKGIPFAQPSEVTFNNTVANVSTLTFSWNPSTNANGTNDDSPEYDFHLYRSNHTLVTGKSSLSQPETTKTVSGLPTNILYYAKVVQINKDPNASSIEIRSAMSRSANAQTGKVAARLVAPTLSEAGDGELKVSWNKIGPSQLNNTTFVAYQVKLEDLSSKLVDSIEIQNQNATTHTFTGLTNGTDYKAAIRVLNNVAWNAYSLLSTELAPVGVLAAPSQFTAVVMGSTERNMTYRDISLVWVTDEDAGPNAGVSNITYDISYSLSTGPQLIADVSGQYITAGTVTGEEHLYSYDICANTGVETHIFSYDLSGDEAGHTLNFFVRAAGVNPNDATKVYSDFVQARQFNMEQAFSHTVYTVPSFPRDVSYSNLYNETNDTNRGQMEVTWKAPEYNKGRQINKYVIDLANSGGTSLLTVTPDITDFTQLNYSYTLGDAPLNQDLSLSVTAHNIAGGSVPGYYSGNVNLEVAPMKVNSKYFDLVYSHTDHTLTYNVDISNYLAEDDLSGTFTFADISQVNVRYQVDGSNAIYLDDFKLATNRYNDNEMSLDLTDISLSVMNKSHIAASVQVVSNSMGSSVYSDVKRPLNQIAPILARGSLDVSYVIPEEASSVSIVVNGGGNDYTNNDLSDPLHVNVPNNTALTTTITQNLNDGSTITSTYTPVTIEVGPIALAVTDISFTAGDNRFEFELKPDTYYDDSKLTLGVDAFQISYKKIGESTYTLAESTDLSVNPTSNYVSGSIAITDVSNNFDYDLSLNIVSVGDVKSETLSLRRYPFGTAAVLNSVSRNLNGDEVTLNITSAGLRIQNVTLFIVNNNGTNSTVTSGNLNSRFPNQSSANIVLTVNANDPIDEYVVIINPIDGLASLEHTFDSPNVLSPGTTHLYE